jgi:hypothetical protein
MDSVLPDVPEGGDRQTWRDHEALDPQWPLHHSGPIFIKLFMSVFKVCL